MILVNVEVVEVESKLKMKIGEEVWNFEDSDISDSYQGKRAKKKWIRETDSNYKAAWGPTWAHSCEFNKTSHHGYTLYFSPVKLHENGQLGSR